MKLRFTRRIALVDPPSLSIYQLRVCFLLRVGTCNREKPILVKPQSLKKTLNLLHVWTNNWRIHTLVLLFVFVVRRHLLQTLATMKSGMSFKGD